MKAATIGLGIAKQVFQVYGADRSEKVVFRRKLRRSEVARFFAELGPCLIGRQPSVSAYYWARVLSVSDHTVKLMAPQFVNSCVLVGEHDTGLSCSQALLFAELSLHSEAEGCDPKKRSELVG